ncbi:purine nucleoside permease [Neisseriaceae bacterium ESL0693]|nr:purine nucleoside permease [Neisseriaceae bacterium ESL0693]
MNQLLRFCSVLFVTLMFFSHQAMAKTTTTKPIPIRVVVVTAFELGEDTGDIAGEFQHWVEQFPLSETIAAPATYHGVLRYNPELQVLGMVTGEGPTRVAASITALASDPRFDLSHAYFILAGIAGVNPNKGTLGTVAWARYAVNGGSAHLLDAREIPADWPDGFTPVQASTPYPQPRPPIHSIASDMVFAFNPQLVNWAYQRTKDMTLPDSAELEKKRQQYKNFPKAQAKPQVILGDTISSETFWSGHKMNQWAERWVNYWTDGKGEMVTTAMEEIALYQALSYQAKIGRVDTNRILSLRAASNFDAPPPGESAAEKLKEEMNEENFIGLDIATRAAYQVGSPIVRELATHWDQYKDHIPQ